jgi:two-component system chemotaxis response regulator CheY
MNILIVDDSRAMRMIIQRALRQAGLVTGVLEAASGAQALELLASSRPDLVLCDWNMPGMSGLELLEKISADGLKVRLGFVTSESRPEMKARATAAGAAFLLPKPFTPEALENEVRSALAS